MIMATLKGTATGVTDCGMNILTAYDKVATDPLQQANVLEQQFKANMLNEQFCIIFTKEDESYMSTKQ